ncbi:hypothetical protein J2W40_001632 [Sphingobium xenophagum]|uniref:Uncharacterized protein n=1 Tax=Sphingobium xenophagum TaxID=121428 RepID=A0ABU1X187_SPHXE|nr:hypothetical protein [Sphingobium xenophagum]
MAGFLPPAQREDWLERIANGASQLCLAHCTALPFILAVLRVLAMVLAVPPRFHLIMLMIAIPFSGLAQFMRREDYDLGWPALFGMPELTFLAIALLI